MKKTIQIFSVLLLVFTILISCKKSTDPADRDFFVGTYKGTVSYNDGATTINSSDGKVTVTKIGDSYSFIFGNGIPDITGVRFEKSNDNSYVSVGSGLTGITVDANNLKMLVTKDGKVWTANCTR